MSLFILSICLFLLYNLLFVVFVILLCLLLYLFFVCFSIPLLALQAYITLFSSLVELF